MGELSKVVVMGMVQKEWWPRGRIGRGLGHRVQRGKHDYPVKGLIHNGAVRSFFFCARRVCFVRDEHSHTRLAGSQALHHRSPIRASINHLSE